MTDIKEVIEELRQLRVVGTPDEWLLSKDGRAGEVNTDPAVDENWPIFTCRNQISLPDEQRSDAALIVAAVNALPALLDHIAELETLCREYSKAMMHHAGGGSEMFKTVAGEPYADPEACSKRISEGREHRQIINDKRIAELEGRKAWRPIESAPKDEHTVVLMSDGDGTWVAELLGVYPYDTDKMRWWPRTDKQFSRMSGFDRSVFRVKQRDFTHWMPLPPPPTEDGGVRDEK